MPRAPRSARTTAIIGAVVAVIAAGLAVGVAGTGPRGAAERDPATERRAGQPDEGRATPSPAPRGNALLGAFVSRGDRSEAGLRAAVAGLEADLGRPLDINHHYRQWFSPEGIVGPLVAWDVAEGRIPMISWHGADSRSITSGERDDWIRRQAQAVAALDSPVLLRYGWEMDSQRNARWAISAADYVAAWRHLRAQFAEVGVANAQWVWCPEAIGFSDGRAQAYYPGDAHVDWLCADGYNFAPGMDGATWRQVPQIFGAFYEWAAPSGKPLMIGETGVQERQPGEKADWIRTTNAALQERLPRIKALIYFDTNARYDWQVTSSPESTAAFRELALDPYWNHWHQAGGARASGVERARRLDAIVAAPAGGGV